METVGSVIPPGMRAQASFLSDLRNALTSPADLVHEIAKLARPFPHPGLADHDRERLAESFGKLEQDVERAAVVVSYLRLRAIQTGASPGAFAAEIGRALDAVSPPVSPQEREAIEGVLPSIIDMPPDDLAEFRSRSAFGMPPTYLASGAELAFKIGPLGDPIGGLLWRVSYLSSESDERTISFGLSPGEARQIVHQLQQALDKLERTRVTLVPQDQPEEGQQG
jgi:hypothetical protein